MSKVLRGSVITFKEWFKTRDPDAWKMVRSQALYRDDNTCVYCGWKSNRFQQVNHIGSESDNGLDNLETVCKACHAVLHLGINAKNGVISVFDCKPEVLNNVDIVKDTRSLVAKKATWPEIDEFILDKYATPERKIYTREESVHIANQLLFTIASDEYRGYLPAGQAVLFHAVDRWQGFSERIHMWQLSK